MTTTNSVIDDRDTGSLVTYEPEFLTPEQGAAMRADIEAHAGEYESGTMLVDGREVPTPRLVVAFGDGSYRWPDMGASQPWPPALLVARARLEEAAGHRFNYALVNVYRNGHDYTGWHADKMHLHVPGTSIAVISLGAVRPLRFRPTGDVQHPTEQLLADRSLLWMLGETQAHYEHAIPKDADITTVRISITFRFVLEPEPGG